MRHRDIGAYRVDSIGAWLLETEGFGLWKIAVGEMDHIARLCFATESRSGKELYHVREQVTNRCVESGNVITNTLR